MDVFVVPGEQGWLVSPLPEQEMTLLFLQASWLNAFVASQQRGRFEHTPQAASWMAMLAESGHGNIWGLVDVHYPLLSPQLPLSQPGFSGWTYILLRVNAQTARLDLIGDRNSTTTLRSLIEGLLRASWQTGSIDFSSLSSYEAGYALTARHIAPVIQKKDLRITETASGLRIELPTYGPALTAAMIAAGTGAFGVPVFLSFIRESKSAEGESNLARLSQGAATYVTQNNPSGPFPESTAWVCSQGGQRNVKTPATQTDWTEQPWSSLGFSITTPHYFRYCCRTSDNRKTFAARAEAILDGGSSPDTFWCAQGHIKQGQPIIGEPFEVVSADACTLP